MSQDLLGVLHLLAFIFAYVGKVSQEELQEAERVIGELGGDNCAGIQVTLHRISATRSRKGTIVGLTCRVGCAVTGHVDMVWDLLVCKERILFLGSALISRQVMARRLQVPERSMHHRVMIEAVENHMPEVITIDEIGTKEEAVACRSICEGGVMLIGTAHGEHIGILLRTPLFLTWFVVLKQ